MCGIKLASTDEVFVFVDVFVARLPCIKVMSITFSFTEAQLSMAQRRTTCVYEIRGAMSTRAATLALTWAGLTMGTDTPLLPAPASLPQPTPWVLPLLALTGETAPFRKESEAKRQ